MPTWALIGRVFSMASFVWLGAETFAQSPSWQGLLKDGIGLAQQRRYREAEHNYLSALQEAKAAGDENGTAIISDNLATLYAELGQVNEAERFYLRAIALFERIQGPDNQNAVISRGHLACLYIETGKFSKAEQILLKDLAAQEHQETRSASLLAEVESNLGTLYAVERRYADAVDRYRDSLAMLDEVDRSSHERHNVWRSKVLTGLATVLALEEKWSDAATFAEQSWNLLTPADQFSPTSVKALTVLAAACSRLNRPEDAASNIRKAMAIAEDLFGSNSRYFASILLSYADILRKMNRRDEAKAVESRAKTILAKNESSLPSKYTIDVQSLLASGGRKTPK